MIYICPLINTPPPTEGVIISQPIFRFLGVIFDEDHDFEGPRSPIAHLDTVLRNLLSHPRLPRSLASGGGGGNRKEIWCIHRVIADLNQNAPRSAPFNFGAGAQTKGLRQKQYMYNMYIYVYLMPDIASRS